MERAIKELQTPTKRSSADNSGEYDIRIYDFTARDSRSVRNSTIKQRQHETPIKIHKSRKKPLRSLNNDNAHIPCMSSGKDMQYLEKSFGNMLLTHSKWKDRCIPEEVESSKKIRNCVDILQVFQSKINAEPNSENSGHLAEISTRLLDCQPQKIFTNSGTISRLNHKDFYKYTCDDHEDYSMRRNLEIDRFLNPLETSGFSRYKRRKLNALPYKVLEAYNLIDDFYLSLIDWSSEDYIAVALSNCLYIWTAGIKEAFNMENSTSRDLITSVKCRQSSNLIAAGVVTGRVDIWDVKDGRKTIVIYNSAVESRDHEANTNRIAALAWNNNLIAVGNRNRSVKTYDVRMSLIRTPYCIHNAHTSEICGIAFNNDGNLMASGGNDNTVYIWDMRYITKTKPLWSITAHVSAVKALAWSPHYSQQLATGGGMKDGRLRIWDIQKRQCLNTVETGSQICGLHWSFHENKIVSAHGYGDDAINIWTENSLECVSTIPSHGSRMLCMSASPDGRSVVTAAGDETVRLFKIFDYAQEDNDYGSNSKNYIYK